MKRLIVFCSVVMMGLSGMAQTSASKFQALFIYNFTRYIEWPSSQSGGDFTIGVLGNGEIVSDLNSVTNGKLVGSRKITVKQFASVSEVSNCQVLFVNRSFVSQFADIQSRFQGKGVLIVTDKPGMKDKGACINFVIDDGKQRFEINRDVVERSGLKISSTLLDMAVASN